MRSAWPVIALALMLGGCSMWQPPASPRAVIAHTLAATVQVTTSRPGAVRRTGSAVVLALQPERDRTLILTTNHLVAPPAAQTITVSLPPEGASVPAKLLATDQERDLALLAAPSLPVQAVRLRPQAALGDQVWVVSFPWGRERTVVAGAVSQVRPLPGALAAEALDGAVQLIDAAVSYGMSGGGVFESADGALVGLVRGYRTAQLALPEDGSKPLNIPVAAETTVISAKDIACFLQRTDLAAAAGLAGLGAGC